MRRPVTVLLLVVLSLVTHGTVTREVEAHGTWKSSGSADVVLEWNQLLQTTIPSNASLAAPRFYSMMHIAMFDAANSVEHDYSRYHVQLWYGAGLSAELAAAQAARDVLVALLRPARPSTMRRSLPGFAAASPWQRWSVHVGGAVAREILAWRLNDGWEATPPAYVLPPFPGLWQPAPGAAAFTHYPSVTPFGLLTGTQYLAPAPPTLTSDRYAQDFGEVKRLGSATSAERTARADPDVRGSSPASGRAPTSTCSGTTSPPTSSRGRKPRPPRSRAPLRAGERRHHRRRADDDVEQVHLRAMAAGDGDSAAPTRTSIR